MGRDSSCHLLSIVTDIIQAPHSARVLLDMLYVFVLVMFMTVALASVYDHSRPPYDGKDVRLSYRQFGWPRRPGYVDPWCRWPGRPGCAGPWFIRIPPPPPMPPTPSEKPTTEETATDPIVTPKTHIKKFYVRDEQVTWQEANKKCKAEGKGLASILSQEEEDRLEETIKKIPGYLEEAYWIGGNDLMEEKTFVWTEGEPFIFTKWYPGYPKYGDKSEQCVAIAVAEGFKWVNVNCFIPGSYICQNYA